MTFIILKNKNNFVHHGDIQDKIFKPSSFSINQHGHYNGNHKVELTSMTPKLVHPFQHSPI
jgi:hypothetical protein